MDYAEIDQAFVDINIPENVVCANQVCPCGTSCMCGGGSDCKCGTTQTDNNGNWFFNDLNSNLQENHVAPFTNGINTQSKGNPKEKFDVNNQGDGSFWNGTVVKNGVNTNTHERFGSSGNSSCECKRITFLLYIVILLLLLIYFKK
jgi:hypothetical protein